MENYERKNRLDEALKIKGMKQVELAERTGLSTAQINSWKKNKWQPKQRALHLMAKVLDVNEMWLAGQDVPMERPIKQKELDQLSDIIRELQKNDRFKSVVDAILKLNDEQFLLIESMLNQFKPRD